MEFLARETLEKKLPAAVSQLVQKIILEFVTDQMVVIGWLLY